MKKFRLFATVLMVALCAMIVSSCSDDDDDKDNEKTLIVGKWQTLDADYESILEFKSNGNCIDSYGGNGKYKIEEGKLSMMWFEEDEPEWEVWRINTLNSTSLIIQVYEDDGTLSDEIERYERIK